MSTTSRPLAVSRSNAVGSSTTRSPVALPSAPVGPSVVAATGAAPDPEGRPSSASASATVAGASTSTRAGVRVPLPAQPRHGAVDDGQVLGEPGGRHGAGDDPVLGALHPQGRHGDPRRGGPGADRALGLDLPARARPHQVVLEAGDPVATVEVVDAVAQVDLGPCPLRVGRVDVDDRLTDLEARDPQRPGRGEGVELAAPRELRCGRRPWRRTPASSPATTAAARARSRSVTAAVARAVSAGLAEVTDAVAAAGADGAAPASELVVQAPRAVTAPIESAPTATPHPRRAGRLLGVSGPDTGPS